MRTEVPADFHKAVMNGIREGEKRMKIRNKLRIATAVAALVIAAVLVASAFEPMGDMALSHGTDKSVRTTPEPTQVTQSDVYVYATERGIRYHSDPACSNMQNPRRIHISQAADERLEPCPKCISSTDYVEIPVKFADNVWMTEHGLYYHMEPDCSGMQNASLAERSYAKQKGKSPCPICSVQRINVSSEKDVFERLEELMPGALACYIGMYGYDNLNISATADEYWRLTMGCVDGPLVEISATENGSVVLFYFGVNTDIKLKLYATLKEKRIMEYEQAAIEKIEKLEAEDAAGYTLTLVCAGFTEDEELYKLVYVFDSVEHRIQAECDVETGEIYSSLMESIG